MAGLDYFVSKLKEGYWVHGGIWEFDWYLTCFFVEAESYGTKPLYAGFEQAVMGDEFINCVKEDKLVQKFSNFFENPKKVENLIKGQEQILSEASNLITDFQTSKEIKLEIYAKIQKDLSLLMALVSGIFDKLIPLELKRISKMSEVPEQVLSEYVMDSASKTELSLSNRNLLEIFCRTNGDIENNNFLLERLNKISKKRLFDHSLHWGWLNTGLRGSKEWNEQDFLNQLKDLVLSRISKEEKPIIKLIDGDTKKDLERIIKININDNKAADRQTFLDYLFQQYLKKRLGDYYLPDITDYLTFAEIKTVLDDKNKIKIYSSRENNILRAAWPQNHQVECFYFESQSEYNRVYKLIGSKKTGQTLIRGVTACKGIAEGVVRVVRTQKDLEKFQRGEILVAMHTQPRYVNIMTKAAAIVTDIGGITSHAAIISREMGIPCVVATGNATELLKNGDFVEVNADSGTVEKR